MRKRGVWWHVVPFVRLLIPLAGGILLYRYSLFWPLVLLAAFGGLVILLLRLLPIYLQFRLRFLPGLWLHVVLVSAGLGLMRLNDLKHRSTWFGHHKFDRMVVKTLGEPNMRGNYGSVVARVSWIEHNSQWSPASGKILVSYPAKAGFITEGSLIGIASTPGTVEAGKGKFNFQAYMAQKQVFHQVRLKAHELNILLEAPVRQSVVHRLQQHILGVLDSHFSGNDRALAKALLVGYRAELEKSLVTAYTNTGVVHIIAISGMHLALIYAMLMMILKPLARGWAGRIVTNLLIMAILWIFTLICGASPSVTRSAVMFCCLLAGDMMGAENNTGNAVAASAFVLLCYDPLLLWDLGFQLSYAAVASLLLYNRSILAWFSPENNILQYTWNGVATSLAAQILTTPLVLVQFHQFPLLFILANFVAVPVSGLILVLLILIVILQFVPAMAALLSVVTRWCIGFMNEQVERLASVQFAVWQNIQWNWLDLIMAYAFILALTMYVRTKKGREFQLVLLTILTWLIAAKYSS